MTEPDIHDADLADNHNSAREAIRSGDVAALSGLLRRHPELARVRAEDGRTLLNDVADWPGRWPRRLESAALLIDAGADVNARATDPDTGETPVQWAASCEDAALTELLVEAGSPVDGVDGGVPPLTQALFYRSTAVAEVLVNHGATVDLEFAAGLGLLERLPTFFDADGNLSPNAGVHHSPARTPIPPADDAENELIEQAMVYAAINGQTEVIAQLLERGADVTAQPSGYTHRIPLTNWARNHPDTVAFLVERGAAPLAESGS